MNKYLLVIFVSLGLATNASVGQTLSEPAWWSKLNPDLRKALQQALKAHSEGKPLQTDPAIQFFGKVVDQDGKAVEGAKVTMEITASNGEIWFKPDPPKFGDLQKTTTTELPTDNQGNFIITDARGLSLHLKGLKKEGYRSAYDGISAVSSWALNQTDPWQFIYSANDALQAPEKIHVPDLKNPVILHMWRFKNPEPLIQSGRDDDFGNESKVYTVDLVKGAKAIEGAAALGDFRIQFKRPVHSVAPKDDWSLVVEAVDGGIVEANDPIMYLAPEGEYKPRYELVMKAVDPKWSNQVEKKFYLRSRGGKVYAAMHFAIRANLLGNSAIEITYLANPAGSRNLEFDPARAIDLERIAKVGLDKAIEEVKAKSGK